MRNAIAWDNIDIDNLVNIEYHDSSLINLNFDFERNSLFIRFENEIDTQALLFSEVSEINMNIKELTNLHDIEINTAEYSTVGEQMMANFIFLLGFGKPSSELNFLFKSAEKGSFQQ